ncbi:Set1:ash2 histone methyltransferase complex [Fasciola hepatica]|uniref:Set1:ash2 histone methyltransferase complex n=1 Tax=Fasciola hepatica TaxID=6192 RepID=A0A4E0R048_FASHE|nr:Set1:ash2 histone methyltransferase complex [Fasciola hepatica]
MTEESDKQATNSTSKPNEASTNPKEYLEKTVSIDVPSGPQCYCMSPRNFSVADFQCSVCYRWFHLDCIAFNIGKSLPFLTAYHFMCKKCNQNGEEMFSRKQANFAVMCQTALANLMWRNNGRLYFSKEKELIPFLEEFWEELTTQPRKGNNLWYPNIHKTLTSSDAFKVVEYEGDLLVCLSNTDIAKMGPSYDRFRALTSQLRTNITKLVAPTGAAAVVQNASGMSEGGGEAFNSVGSKPGQPGFDSELADSVNWRKRKSPGSASMAQLASGTASAGSNAYGHYSAAGGSSYHNQSMTEFTGVVGSSGGDFGSNGFGSVRGIGSRANGSSVAAANNAVPNGGLVRPTRRTAGANGICGATAICGPSFGPDEGRAKLNSFGFPVDHPLNKEGYRYILVESDKHAAGRAVWDECEHTAGKPIPGLFYRVYLSPQVVLSLNDRANHLKLHESQLIITGDKGYCMARATHGVHTGTWYYEATITDQPEGSATRIGWSQMLGNLQAPCGYDKFGYSWRSRFGTVFHDSRGQHYSDTGYKKDDVIGMLIHLPSAPLPLKSRENLKSTDSSGDPVRGSPKSDPAVSTVSTSAESSVKYPARLLESYKDRPLIKFRNSYYFEEKDEPTKAEKLLRPLPGSKITFYRNGLNLGTAFTDIYAGIYFPSVSVYRSATVSVNFGPSFQYPPTDVPDWKPMSERLVGAAVEQTMADMLYLVENDGLVDRMIKNYSGSA